MNKKITFILFKNNHTNTGDIMKTCSIWSDSVKDIPSKPLDKNINVDVLIIGGGITGLSVAYELINSNLKVALVERNTIGSGVTCNSTGKLTYLQEDVYTKICKTFNKEVAKTYLESQKFAINHVKEIIKTNNIECDFSEVSSYLFASKKKDIEKIKKEKQILEDLQIKVQEESNIPGERNIEYCISVSDTGEFNPVKYLVALKKFIQKNNIDIYENTNVVKISRDDDYIVNTEKYTIRAKKVVLALHYPYFLIPYFMPLKVHLEKSYLGAYASSKFLPISAITISKPTTSLRYVDSSKKYKICLNGSHILAVKYNNKDNFKKFLNEFGASPDYFWSNIDIITGDRLPLIGQIDDNLLLATGYNTWGMTNGILAGVIIKNQILNLKDEYASIFNPKRINKSIIISYPINIWSSVKTFIGTKVNKNRSWYQDNVYFTDKLGIYIDESGKKHIVYNKCPHLKCSLIFNEVEKTWDCPCHGSRFDLDGKVIKGPSNYNITYIKKD